MVFDFTIAAGMVVGLVGRHSNVGESVRGVLLSFNTLARNMRVVRVLRVLTFLRITRGIIRTLITCIPKLANVIVLVMLVYTIIAAVAVQWFGAVKYGSMLGPSVNFETFIQVCYLASLCIPRRPRPRNAPILPGRWDGVSFSLYPEQSDPHRSIERAGRL